MTGSRLEVPLSVGRDDCPSEPSLGHGRPGGSVSQFDYDVRESRGVSATGARGPLWIHSSMEHCLSRTMSARRAAIMEKAAMVYRGAAVLWEQPLKSPAA